MLLFELNHDPEYHDGWNMWSRNFLPFHSIWFHPYCSYSCLC